MFPIFSNIFGHRFLLIFSNSTNMVRQGPSKMQEGTPQILPNTSDQLLGRIAQHMKPFCSYSPSSGGSHSMVCHIAGPSFRGFILTYMKPHMLAGKCPQHTSREFVQLHMYMYNYLPVVPARGGAEVALDLIIRPFSSIELARDVRPACLRCGNLLYCCCPRT